MGNIAKLSMSDIMRLQRDLGLRILGAAGMLHAYDGQDRRRSTRPPATRSSASSPSMALFAQAPPIYGGTDQIQRNIIGERVLGLPKEPNNDKHDAVRRAAQERLKRDVGSDPRLFQRGSMP